MTGRAAGFCAGFTTPGFANPVPGRGFWGRGRGGGRGWRHWYYATGIPGWQRSATFPSAPVYGRGWPYAMPAAAPLSREQELEALKGQAEYFEQSLSEIRKRLEELQAKEIKE